MNSDKTRLYAGGAIALVVAAGVGFGLAKTTTPKAPAPAAAAAPKPAKPEGGAKKEAGKDAIALSPERIKGAGIEFQPVAAGGLDAEILASATVASAPDGQAVLTARASGAITRIFKRLGDAVRAGETVAVIESRDAATISAERSSAAAKATLAQKTLARERYLFEQKVSPRADLEQAQAEAASAAAEVRRASASASAARVAADGRSVLVASPISGRITAAAASLGSFVQSETELFRIADPRRIQIEAAVPAVDAQRIAPGDTATVDLGSGTTLPAVVRAVTPGVNAETRSATVVLALQGGASLSPGQLVRVRLVPRGGGAGSGALVVPEEAVQTFEGRDVVFLRTPEGFRAQPVLVGRRGPGRIEIVSGLSGGQSVATRNAFLLKAELGKSTEEEG